MPDSSHAATPPLAESSWSPGLVSVLPLLYVAWADGMLAPSQIDEIREHIQSADWLSDEECNRVAKWLDPANPPSATQYNRWRQAIRERASALPGEASESLAELGLALGRLSSPDGGGWAQDETREALKDLEEVLGVIGSEVIRDLLKGRPTRRPPSEEHTFDTESLQALLDQPEPEIRERVRKLLQDEIFRYEEPLGTDVYRERVYRWCKRLAEQGLGSLGFPESVGGGGSLRKFVVAFETLSYHDMSLVVKFGVQFGLFGGSIQQLGTKRHHQKYLADVGTLELPGAFAMSELGHGSNVRELETTAHYERESQEFIINTPSNRARKEWIGNAACHGRMATVFAQLYVEGEHFGVHAFLVPIRDEEGQPHPRVRITDNGHKVGLNGVDNGRIWFDNVRIPRENLLNRFGDVAEDGTYSSPIPSSSKRFFTMLGTLVGGRVSVAAAALSAAKSGLTIAIRYGTRRRQFGPQDEPEVPLLDYLTHQRKLFPLLANAYAYDAAVSSLIDRYSKKSGSDQELENHAAGLKALSSWNTTHTLQTARECCGGQGYLTVNRIGRLRNDTDIFSTFEGSNTVLMLQVAKGLLSDFKQEFQDMNFFGMVRYLGNAAATRISEQNPLVRRNTDKSHLRSRSFQQTAFEQRERALLRSVAQRLRARIQDGTDSYDAFIECQDHLLTLAHAHIELYVYNSFATFVEENQDHEAGEVLRHLRDLYALYHFEAHRGWYLEKNMMDGVKSKAVRNQVNELCGEIRPHALALVDAFGIPDSCLAAPIALGDPSHGA